VTSKTFPSVNRRTGAGAILPCAALLLVSASGLGEQPAIVSGSAPAAGTPASPTGGPVREIDDPHTGQRWLLYRDSSHPGGPGRLVQAGSESVLGRVIEAQTGSAVAAGEPPVILRAGDRVILEESTPRVEARLEAVALGPALEGAAVLVRLKLGGRIVSAVAVAPGRVAMIPAAGEER
jgi:hypothetical protein